MIYHNVSAKTLPDQSLDRECYIKLKAAERQNSACVNPQLCNVAVIQGQAWSHCRIGRLASNLPSGNIRDGWLALLQLLKLPSRVIDSFRPGVLKKFREWLWPMKEAARRLQFWDIAVFWKEKYCDR